MHDTVSPIVVIDRSQPYVLKQIVLDTLAVSLTSRDLNGAQRMKVKTSHRDVIYMKMIEKCVRAEQPARRSSMPQTHSTETFYECTFKATTRVDERFL